MINSKLLFGDKPIMNMTSKNTRQYNGLLLYSAAEKLNLKTNNKFVNILNENFRKGRRSDNNLINNNNTLFESKRYSVNPKNSTHQVLEDFSNSFQIIGKNKENKLSLSLEQNIELKLSEKPNTQKIESFADLEYRPTMPIEDNDQSISIIQDFTDEKPTNKLSIKVTNAQPHLIINQEKKKNSLRKLDYLMLESTEVFKHIDEELNSEKKRIVPHDSAKVNSKFREYRDIESTPQSAFIHEEENTKMTVKLTPSSNKPQKHSDFSPDSISPTPFVGSEINEGSHHFIKRKSRITNCKSTSALNKVDDEDSNDSIGADADLSNINEELPSIPAISVMNNSEVFRLANLSKIKHQIRNKNKGNASIAK